MTEQQLAWWRSQYSGLETDSCPTIDLPDNELGGALARVSLPWRGDAELLTAAFAYILGKFTCQNESLFWIREAEGFSHPFYLSFDETAPTADYLSDSAARRRACLEHPEAEETALAEALGLSRDILLCLSGPAPTEAGWRLCLRPEDDCLALYYREGWYLAENMERLLKALLRVAEQLSACPRLCELVLAGPEDLAQQAAFPHWDLPASAPSVPALLARSFAQNPERTAVVYESERWTYRTLDALTDRIGAAMADRGIGKGKVVSTLLPRCKWMPAVAIAVLKTGAAYQPLDPSYPPERLNFMVQDSSAALLVADRELRTLLTDYDGPVLYTDELSELPAAGPLDREIGPQDPFILLYTSGTTGTPKGVILTHGNLVSFIDWYIPRFELNTESRSAAYASFGFDANMMDTYPILCAGGQLHILSDEVRFDLRAIDRYFNENQITHSFMTTQVGRQYALMTSCPSLRFLSVGGEALVPLESPKGISFFNVYGPTECTILTTIYQVRSGSKRLPIGVPLNNLRLYVADRFHRLLPVGALGELLIAGAQVGAGYLNRPEKSAEVFIRNPFDDDPRFQRMYCSGDVVRWGADGNVEFVGRRDGQVKIRGFRIEMTEVERVIRDYPGVTDATVVAKDAPAGGKMIVGYLVADHPVDMAELERFILERKPPYMVPAVTMQIDKIPLNVNSKVDKRALPEPVFAAPAAEDAGPRARTALEETLYQIVGPIVGVEDFPVEAALDTLGLTSISALMLAVELEDRFGHSPDVSALPHSSLLSIENELVAHFMQAKPAESAPAQAEGPYPLTKTQLGIYAACMLDPENDSYQLPFLFRLDRHTDVDRLCRALEQTVAAHPALHCRIVPDRSCTAVMVPVENDFTIQPREGSEAFLEARLAEGDRFDLEHDAPYRIEVWRTEAGCYLYLNFHHILFDGSSLVVFMEDLARAFAGEELTPESYSQFSLALDERAARQSPAYEEAKAVYDRIFNGVDVNSLPEADGGDGQTELHTQWLRLGEGLPEKVQAWCRANQVTENAFFTCAFAYTLARIAGQEEALFCNIYNGRNDPRSFRILGMLVKTYPFYQSFAGGEPIAETVRSTAARIRELTANDLYSFAELSAAYGIKPDILFAYQGSAFLEFSVAGQTVKAEALGLKDVQAALSVDVFLEDGGYAISADYAPERYSGRMIRSLLGLFGKVATDMLRAPSLAAIDLMTPEAAALLEQVNDTDWPVEYRPAHCLLERSAAACPEKLAVVTPTEKLTYRELNALANRLAHGLIALGVGPGRIAALMLERSARVYVTRQGILKSGGAFLSIDPAYPDDRVRVMCEDSGAAVLIVTRDILEARKAFLDSLPCRVLTVEELLLHENDTNPDIWVEPDELCYSIFTSGSTGKPKGVLLTQKNLINFVDANPKNPEILGYTNYASVSLALAAITFDVSIMEEFIPLAHGMTIAMTTEEEIHNPAALARFMTENGVDMMSCTPSFLSNCIGLSVMKPALVHVKSYDFGAEAFPAALYGKIKALNPEAHIMNGYGPTEATVSCTVDVVTDPGYITIGRPASNVRAYVLDAQDRPLPPLIPGELVIAGDGVGRGYVLRPELNAEKFFTVEGRRAYRSGDLAAWTPDGRIRFRGRTDNQVKLRGLRVELGEIESAINACPDVLTSIVIMTGEENNRFLAGYYTASREIDPAEVKAEISRSLTGYMVPGVLMQLPEMPLTQNGKIDKKKLPQVEYQPDQGEYIAPANETEADFCGWFAELLNLDKVSADGNFFELGGTSLSAAIIAMNAADKGYPIVYADVFKAQTPRALAALAKGEAPEAVDPELEALRSYDYGTLDLSHNDEAFLREIRRGEIGSILLAGASGFLGIHVLREYLHDYSGTAFCLLRGRQPLARLKELYYYYFEEALDRYLAEGRVQIVNADVTDAASLAAAEQIPFDTCINCAALVKHFVKDDSLERVNVTGVKNLIALCRKTGRRLVQTSTVSVAGEGLDGQPPRDWTISERELYHGQLLDNAYVLSKFKAERAMLEAVAQGLDGKIARLGNLMGRHSDGEFQVNFRSNAFIRSLASYKAIGAVPYSQLNALTDFSEIDMTAKAILLLAGTDKRFTVFHPINNHTVTFADILYAMRAYGFDLEAVEDEEFARSMAEAGSAGGALIAYESKEGAERRYELGADCAFTTNALYRLGFKWPVTGETYIVQMLKALDELEMFEEDL